ncbi:tRNA (adenine(58)-N(1))-methyltransferase non-catalytic subunit TRM6 [Trinorchestia longiramus]|nr:tRNA (adenine(58)-N(1))-methyltransferase non-catalytic subunit TRM6 [Trinorchestia longiramus]
MAGSVISEGCWVIIQKGAYIRTSQVSAGKPWLLGRKRESFYISLASAIGEPFGTTFQMVLVNDKKKIYNLQKLSFNEVIIHGQIADGCNGDFGLDNRDLSDAGTSQKLTKEEILALKASGASGEEVIQAITANSATFSSKTKYSQQKYVGKKGKKHCELVTLHKPSIDFIAESFYSNNPRTVSYLRPDSLYQVLSYCNVYPGCRALTYDSGTRGLVTAALLHRVGPSGRLVHVYSGDKGFKGPLASAVSSMDFDEATFSALSLLDINRLHKVLKPGKPSPTSDEPLVIDPVLLRGDSSRPPSGPQNAEPGAGTLPSNGHEEDPQANKRKREEEVEEGSEANKSASKKKSYPRDRNSCELVSRAVLQAGVSSLVIAGRDHPAVPTLALLPFLLPGCPFAIFCSVKEPLMELFLTLKSEGGTNLRLSETWLREFQVMPERTHPLVNMSGGGGFILSGTKIRTGEQF